MVEHGPVERLGAPEHLRSRAAPRGWHLEVLSGSAAGLHGESVQPRRTLRVNLVKRPALVLGSSQPPPDHALPAGIDLAVRRSGGGAVWLTPGHQVWLDVVLPAGDALWRDDVSRAALWLGAAWARCIGNGARVCDGPMQRPEAGAVACFAGLAAGEVRLGDTKVVGISQRRTRDLARFQCVAYLRWDPNGLIDALRCGDEVAQLLRDWAGALAPERFPAGRGEWGVVERLVEELP